MIYNTQMSIKWRRSLDQ